MEGEFQETLTKYPDREFLGAGGQTRVYKVNDSEHGEAVLKIGKYPSPKAQERMNRAVQLLSELDSEYFPRFFSFEEFPDGRFVILEEYIEGQTLANCMDKFFNQIEALTLIRKIVEAASILWEQQVVHRDLKPSNIIVRENGDPVIIDLGVMRNLNLEDVTGDSGAPFTSRFAAPEQIQYARDQNEPRTDQFLIGIMLFMLLAQGAHPFDPALIGGENIPHNIVNGKWPKSILDDPQNENFRELLTRLLAREPYGRYRDGNHLIQALDECMDSINNGT